MTGSDTTPIAAPLLEVRGLSMDFTSGSGLGRLVGQPPRVLHALRNVSLTVGVGEMLGVVGESGCGKSTLGRCIAGLYQPTRGEIFWQGAPLAALGGYRERSRQIQMIFQDPYSSLNPRMSIRQMLEEVLTVHTPADGKGEVRDRLDELLLTVGLSPALKERLPHALSGGQRQRVSIARALAPKPRLIVADEPVSALDASVQAQIINLFDELRERLGIAFIFVAHDLDVVRHISQRIAVMYLGEVVETAPAETLFAHPVHPYSRGLIAAIPSLDPERRTPDAGIDGELPDPMKPPAGCAFSGRCSHVLPDCRQRHPNLEPVTVGHLSRCLRNEAFAA